MTLYNLRQAALALSIPEATMYGLVKKTGFPKPHHTHKLTSLWGVDQLAEMKSFLHLKHGVLISRTQIARQLRVHSGTLGNWILAGKISPPTHGSGIRKFYTSEEAEAIKLVSKDIFCQRLVPTRDAERHGYFTQKGASRHYNIPHVTLVSWLNTFRIPRPTHSVNNHLCYTTSELEHFRTYQLVTYFAKRNAVLLGT